METRTNKPLKNGLPQNIPNTTNVAKNAKNPKTSSTPPAWRYTARRDWKDDAYCFGMPSEIFYGHSDLPMSSQQINYAKSICKLCEVQRDCLISALKTKEPYGVWGGFTAFERRAALARNKNDIKKAMDDYDNKEFVAPRRRKK